MTYAHKEPIYSRVNQYDRCSRRAIVRAHYFTPLINSLLVTSVRLSLRSLRMVEGSLPNTHLLVLDTKVITDGENYGILTPTEKTMGF